MKRRAQGQRLKVKIKRRDVGEAKGCPQSKMGRVEKGLPALKAFEVALCFPSSV